MTQNEWLREALEGLDNDHEVDDSTVPSDEIDFYPIHKRPVSAKNKKTIQQRRREMRRKKEVTSICSINDYGCIMQRLPIPTHCLYSIPIVVA